LKTTDELIDAMGEKPTVSSILSPIGGIIILVARACWLRRSSFDIVWVGVEPPSRNHEWIVVLVFWVINVWCISYLITSSNVLTWTVIGIKARIVTPVVAAGGETVIPDVFAFVIKVHVMCVVDEIVVVDSVV
jgi:hypothetical protein